MGFPPNHLTEATGALCVCVLQRCKSHCLCYVFRDISSHHQALNSYVQVRLLRMLAHVALTWRTWLSSHLIKWEHKQVLSQSLGIRV